MRVGDGVVYVAHLGLRVLGAQGLWTREGGEPGAGHVALQVLLLTNRYDAFAVENIADFKVFANRREVWLNSVLSAYYMHCHIYLPILFCSLLLYIVNIYSIYSLNIHMPLLYNNSSRIFPFSN